MRLHGRFDVDAALVDLDGTLVDTLDDFVAALNAMLADLPAPWCGARVQRSRVAELIGKGSENLIKSVLRLVDPAQGAINVEAHAALFEVAWPLYQKHYGGINGAHASVYAGVEEALQKLAAQGLRMVCLTNKPTAFARTLLERKQLDRYFCNTFGGDACARKKPDPLPLLQACAALGTAPQRTLMVGDSSNDAQAARAAGCPVVLVTYGYNHGAPVRSVDADAYLDSLTELLAR